MTLRIGIVCQTPVWSSDGHGCLFHSKLVFSFIRLRSCHNAQVTIILYFIATPGH